VPSAEKRSAAEREIAKKFSVGADNMSRLDRQGLALKLCRAAEATKDSPAMRYVLLDRATDEAVHSGDIETLLKALGHLSKDYEGDWLTIRVRKLKAAGAIVTWPDQYDLAVKAACAVADEAAEDSRFDLAASMLDALRQWARLRDDKPLVTRTEKRHRAASSRASAQAACANARDVLKRNPNSAEAHFAIGRFMTFHQGEWPQGLVHLGKGSNPGLKALALREGKSGRTSGEALALAEGWAAAAGKEHEPIREHVQRHAMKLYTQAVRGKSGAELAAAEKRLLDLRLAVASRDMNLLKQWKIARGKWQQTPDGKIRGEGNSRANFKQKLPHDFYIQFRMNVASGLRPRVYFDGTQMFIGNEGITQNIRPHGVKSYRGVPKYYVNGEEMLVGVLFEGTNFEWFVNGVRIGRGELKETPRHVTVYIRGGDEWSKGTVLYWDFKVLSKKPATSSKPAEKKTEVTR